MSTPRYVCQKCNRKHDNYHDFNDCCESKQTYAEKVKTNKLAFAKKNWFKGRRKKQEG